MTLEWTLNVQENILSTFCFSLQFLNRDKTLCVCFLSSFFPKFWRGQIVPLTVFLRDNFNCSAGLAQWCSLAQTLQHCWSCRMQDVSLTIEFLWLSGRASELAIWRSEVWFLIVNLVLLSWQNNKTSFPNIFLITVATKIIHFQALNRFSSEKALFPVRMKYVLHYAKPSWCWTYSLNLESSPLRCFW